MKKFSLFICCAVFTVCLLFTIPAKAQVAETVDSGTCGENLIWTLDAAGTLTICGTGEMQTYWDWQEYSNDIRKVVIENGATSIDADAFRYCSNLTSVEIPESVTNIEGYAFGECTGLVSVTLGAGVRNVGYGAFSDCTSLVDITMSGVVTTIGSDAFGNCTSLTSVEIPESVTSIGGFAFEDCTSLASVTIGDGAIDIASSAFSGCTSLKYNVYDNAKYLGNSTNPYSALIKATTYTIPDCTIHPDTRNVCAGAFANCKNLVNIIIPNRVTTIGDSAFSSCSSLSSILIADSVTSVGGYAFARCDSLTCITIPASVTAIGQDVFYGSDNLASICVEEENAMYASDTKGVLFNKEITELIQVPKAISGTYAIPYGVTFIGDAAFEDCIHLTGITIPDSVISIGYIAFQGCSSLKSVTIPDSVTFIDTGAFAKCRSLTSVEIPGSVVELRSTFYLCDNLSSVFLNEGLTHLYSSVFSGCNLKEVSIPDSVVYISGEAFDSCTALTSVTIGKGVATIGRLAFGNCTSLESFYVDKANAYFSSDSFGVLYNKDKTKLIQCPGAYQGNFEVPDSVTEIGPAAFAYCSDLTSVSLPSSVTKIDTGAFSYTYGFAIEGGIHYVRPTDAAAGISAIIVSEENTVFSGLNGVLYSKDKSVLLQVPSRYAGQLVIPESVRVINENAVAFCSELTGLIIPNTVTEIEKYAFYACDLKTIVLPNQLTSIKEGTFYNSGIREIVIPDSVITVDMAAFSDCKELIAVTIPDSLINIGFFAFCCCDSLTTVTIPDSVTTIEPYAFEHCYNLTSVTIPDSVTDIGEGAFYGCDSLAIYGNKESFARQYAEENNISFVVIENYQAINGEEKFTTLQEALDAYQTGTIQLLTNVDSVTITKNAVVDLNGFSISSVTATAATLTVLDSKTDDYSVADNDYGKIASLTGTITPATGYIAIAEKDGTSYHKVSLKITHMSLRSADAGVYYKCTCNGDEMVAAQVTSYGVALSVRGTPKIGESGTGYSVFTNFVSGNNTPSTLLKNVMKDTNTVERNNSNADVQVYGRAYIQIGDSYIYGETVSRSFREQVELVDTIWSTLTAQQQTAVLEMCRTFQEDMAAWTIPNIKNSI